MIAAIVVGAVIAVIIYAIVKHSGSKVQADVAAVEADAKAAVVKVEADIKKL